LDLRVNINCFLVEYVAVINAFDMLVVVGSPRKTLAEAAAPYINPNAGFAARTGNGARYSLPT